MNLFGQIIGKENWDFLNPDLNSTQLVELFHFFANGITDTVFPEKEISIREDDKPYFTEQLRRLKRLRCREYNKHGKSNYYTSLVTKFNDLMKTELGKYKQKLECRMQSGQIGSILFTHF